MKLQDFIENEKWMGIAKKVFYGALVFFVLLDFFTPRHHPQFIWDKIPGFSALFGFSSCVLIIVASKALGKWWVQKPEDHYD